MKVLACSSNTITAGQLATNWDSQETNIFFGKSNSRKIEDARYRANKSICYKTKICYKMLQVHISVVDLIDLISSFSSK